MSDGAKLGLEQLLSVKDIVVTCGPGGVGKTTVAAAIGLGAAVRTESKVLVLTVDPARRLGDALGLAELGNEARRVPIGPLGGDRRPPKGELYAAMLDTKTSWDELVRRHAPNAATASEILANPLYANITGRFARSHEYIAMERLFELHAEGRYDLLVIDTPPSHDALAFLDAPRRMADFFSSRLLRWLTAPVRSRLVNLASRPFSQVGDRILGTQFLEDVGRFFLLFQTMYQGFVDRARAVEAVLEEATTTFVVVTTPEIDPMSESRRLVEALERRHLHLGAIVANKVLPSAYSQKSALTVAETLGTGAPALAGLLAGDATLGAFDPDQLARVLAELGGSFSNFALLARRERELLGELAAGRAACLAVPHLMEDVADLAALVGLSDLLYSGV